MKYIFTTVYRFFTTVDSPMFFFSMKTAESRKIVLESCIIDFDDVQVSSRVSSLSVNIGKIMTVCFKIWP
jgi:hypothetical protein